MFRLPPRSTLFPYTTLFRSERRHRGGVAHASCRPAAHLVSRRRSAKPDRSSRQRPADRDDGCTWLPRSGAPPPRRYAGSLARRGGRCARTARTFRQPGPALAAWPRRPCALLDQIVNCAVCDDVDELLELGIDAAIIAAPTHLHHDIALTCIKRGVHVLVEKPIASNVEEGRAIVAAAERAGVTLMVGHVERFNPAVQAIKDAINGEDILSIAITRVGPFPPRMSNVGEIGR